jgi:hypothetical protein
VLGDGEARHRAAEELPPVADPLVGYGAVDTYALADARARAAGEPEDEESAEERLARRLGTGLGLCHRAAVVSGLLCAADPADEAAGASSMEAAVARACAGGDVDETVLVNLAREALEAAAEGELREMGGAVVRKLESMANKD